jgi:8-oxo-dGTP pyrophosphatase MutT (NUDIX family)
MSQRGPWRVIDNSVAYENPWIRVEHHDVISPGQQPGIYGVVHFKHYAVGVIPLEDNLDTWIVGQYRYPLQRYSWEIPEGGAAHSESLLEAAQRELREEVGLVARDWELIHEFDTSNSVTDEQAYIYVARGLHREGAPEPEHTEQLALRRVPFSQLHAEVLQGLHRDSLTVVGVLKLAHLLDHGLLRPVQS